MTQDKNEVLGSFQALVTHLKKSIGPEMLAESWRSAREIYWYAHEIRLKTPDPIGLPDVSYFQISEENAESLCRSALEHRDAYDLAVDTATLYLRFGIPIPYSLGRFAARVLSGDFPAPKKTTNPAGDRLWARDWHILHVMTYLPDHFGLPPTRNESHGENGISVADAVAQVFSAKLGTQVTYESVKKVWDNAEKRRGFSALKSFFLKHREGAAPD